MENGKQMAFPTKLVNGELHTGLTKREYFSIHIATGLSVQAIAGGHNSINQMEIDVPLYAVRIADALLKALENKSE